MAKHIPFSVWFSDTLEIIETINKCNFDVLEKVKSYKYGSLTIQYNGEGTYSFKVQKSAEKYNPTASSGQAGVSILKSNLWRYEIELLCTRDDILKLQVTENWNGSFTYDYAIHVLLFNDNDILVNGEWFKIDSSDAFLNDVNNDEISVLAIIELIENFRKNT